MSAPPGNRYPRPAGPTGHDVDMVQAARTAAASPLAALTMQTTRVVHVGQGMVSNLDPSGTFGPLGAGPMPPTSAMLKRLAHDTGRALSKRSADMSLPQLQAEAALLNDMAAQLQAADPRPAAWPAHDQRVRQKRARTEWSPADYRGLMPDQDEINSSSPTASLLSGMRSVKSPAAASATHKAARADLHDAAARMLSSARAPTQFVKTRLRAAGETADDGSDHPTTAARDLSTQQGRHSHSAHSYSDRARAAQGQGALDAAIPLTTGVAVPLVMRSLGALAAHTTTMTLPGQADNVPLQAPPAFLATQTASREVAKAQASVLEGLVDSRALPAPQSRKKAVTSGHQRAASPPRSKN